MASEKVMRLVHAMIDAADECGRVWESDTSTKQTREIAIRERGKARAALVAAIDAEVEAARPSPACAHPEIHGTGNTRDGITAKWCARCGVSLP